MTPSKSMPALAESTAVRLPMARYHAGAVFNGATLTLASPNGVGTFRCRCGSPFVALIEDVKAGDKSTCGCGTSK